MAEPQFLQTSRRSFLKTTGHLMIGFSLYPIASCETKGSQMKAPPYVGTPPRPHVDSQLIDSWIRLDAEGHLTVRSVKKELGQGIKIALIQIAAEELDIEPGRCHIVNSDTGQTPNEGFTAGSNSVEGSGSAIRLAAAEARLHLLKMAGQKWNVATDNLMIKNGVIKSPSGEEISYWKLLEGEFIEAQISGEAPLKSPKVYKYVGQPLEREDIRKMVIGEPHFVHDLKMPGMVHARILHPPSYNDKLKSIDLSELEAMPGDRKSVV